MDSQQSMISADELQRQLESGSPPMVVDVRLEEDWQSSRLPGALGNCVFEIAFLHRMAEMAPDRAHPVVVYGADAGSLESRMAAEKLRNRGYQDVREFRDGLLGWTAAGCPIEESGPAPSPEIPADGAHPVDLTESKIHWFGRNLLNRHEGLVALKSGSLQIHEGRLTGGSFVVDMRAITSLDLAGNPLHDVLIRHLMDYDFFEVEKYPEARFTIKSATEIAGATPGAPNLAISGILAMKDVNSPLEFDATAGMTPDGKLAAQTTVSFDRTRWHVLYGSGKWFRRLGGHLVNDMIEVQLRIVSA